MENLMESIKSEEQVRHQPDQHQWHNAHFVNMFWALRNCDHSGCSRSWSAQEEVWQPEAAGSGPDARLPPVRCSSWRCSCCCRPSCTTSWTQYGHTVFEMSSCGMLVVATYVHTALLSSL
jgi:hypothetical protein